MPGFVVDPRDMTLTPFGGNPPPPQTPPAHAHFQFIYRGTAFTSPGRFYLLLLFALSSCSLVAHTLHISPTPKMAGQTLRATADVSRVEAPVTTRAYFLCVFAAFGGILFGFDSGYISGVLAMDFFKRQFGRPVDASVDASGYLYATWEKSLITSILSAGTFFGALFSGSLADWIGRRLTIITGCITFIVGVVLQVASTSVPLLVVGRVIAGFGVGIVSAIIILYMSEISPKAVRGAIVSGYQFAITIGLLLASCVDQATHLRNDTGSYRIPIAIQFLWGLILGIGLFFLPESPRYFVMKGKLDKAAHALSRLRGQPQGSELIQEELAELVANYEYEINIMSHAGWIDCFKGGFKPSGNLRRTVLGIAMQMFQQWTGVNFICMC